MGARRELKRAIIKAAHESMALSRQLGAEQERERIIELIRKTYADTEVEEYGSFVYSEDVIELIEKSK